MNGGQINMEYQNKGIQIKNQIGIEVNAANDNNTKINQNPEQTQPANNSRCKLILIFISFIVVLSCSMTVLILSVIDQKDGFISTVNTISFPSGVSSYLIEKYTVKNFYTWKLKLISLALTSCILSSFVGIVVLIFNRFCKLLTSKKGNETQAVITTGQNKSTKQPLINKTQQLQIHDSSKPQNIQGQENDNTLKQTQFPLEQHNLIIKISKFLILLYSCILLGLIVALGHHLSFLLDWNPLNVFDIDEPKLYIILTLQTLSLIYTSFVYVMITYYFLKNQQSQILTQPQSEIPKQSIKNDERNPQALQIRQQQIKKDRILLSPNNDDKNVVKVENTTSHNNTKEHELKQKVSKKQLGTLNTQKKLSSNLEKNNTSKPQPNLQNNLIIPINQAIPHPKNQNHPKKKIQNSNQDPGQNGNYSAPNTAHKETQRTNKEMTKYNQQITDKQKSNNSSNLIPKNTQNSIETSKKTIEPQPKLINEPSKQTNQSASVFNQPLIKITSPKNSESPTVFNLNPTNNAHNSKSISDNSSQLLNPFNKNLQNCDEIEANKHKIYPENSSVLTEKDSLLNKQIRQALEPAYKKSDPLCVQRIPTSPQPFVLKPLGDLPQSKKSPQSSFSNQDKLQISESLVSVGNGQNKLNDETINKSKIDSIKNVSKQEIKNYHVQESSREPHAIKVQQPKYINNSATMVQQLITNLDRKQRALSNQQQIPLQQTQLDQKKRHLQNSYNNQLLPFHSNNAHASQIQLNQASQNIRPQKTKKHALKNQQPFKKKLSFCSGIYSIEQSSPFSTMVTNVFKSRSNSKTHLIDEGIRLTPVTNIEYQNHNPKRNQERQQDRFQTNKMKKFDIQNQVQTSPIYQRFSPINKKVTMPQEHISSQNFFKKPQVQISKSIKLNKNNQKTIPDRRLVPLKQQVYNPYGYQSIEKNTTSQVSSYQSGAQFYHNSIKKEINKSNNRIWNHSTTYSTDNELIQRKNVKLQKKSPSSGSEISYYNQESFKKQKKNGKQSGRAFQKQEVNSVKKEQLKRIKQEEAKIQQIYLNSQRRIQNKINMLNASIQQKQLDSKLIEESIKFMNQTNFNSVLNPVIEQNKKLRLLQEQQRIQDEQKQQERERLFKIKQEKLLKLRKQRQMKEKQKLMEEQKKLQASRVSKQLKLGRKTENSRGQREKDQGQTNISRFSMRKSNQVSKQTFSNGEPSIIINKDAKVNSQISSLEDQDPLPTKQELQYMYLQRLRELGNIQSPSLNAYMERVMYKRRNSENNFNQNGFEPVWVKVESPYKKRTNKIEISDRKKQPNQEYKKLDFVLLTPESINKNKNNSSK